MAATKEQKLAHYHRKQAEKNELRNTHPQIDSRPKRPRIKARCRDSLEQFALRYYPELFPLPFSQAHRDAIARIEAAILRGEQFALAMPRGSGKTTICRVAVIWAAVYGHSAYTVLIGATDTDAVNALKAIKDLFRYGDRLAEDFPRLVIPIRALNGEPRATMNQTYAGVNTGIAWSKDRLTLPFIDGEPGSEAVIDTASVTGAIRGRSYTRRDGSSVRPTVAIVDDPQSRRSARSASETAERLAVILGDVAYLAGPGQANGLIVVSTVIRKGDLADQVLDREQHPEFHGRKVSFFASMPTDLQRWEGKYATLRRQAFIEDREPIEANRYYADHRTAMDAGAAVYWDARFNPKAGEISAVQHGMNLYLRDRASFLAEYQNEPEAVHDVSPVAILSEAEIGRKVNGLPRLTCPADTAHVVAMIDVHPQLLYYAVVAVKSDFTGAVIDYGVYPEQPSRDFSHQRPHKTLADVFRGSEETNITKGLTTLTDMLCGREYACTDGRTLTMGKCLLDTGYMPGSVFAAIQRSEHRAVLMGSRGVGLTPESKPFSEYDLSPSRVRQYGPRGNCRWYVPASGHSSGVVRFDKYHHLQLVHARFVTPVPEPSAWELFGDKYTDHRMIASHLQGQRAVEVHARGRSIIQWQADRSREDHWLDCLVGCCVAASTLGCEVPGGVVVEQKQEFVKLSDMYGRKGRR